MTTLDHRRTVWLVGFAFLALHWSMQAAGVYPLMFDETQYWLWGKNPDWGYYSKPPMIGWLMGISTALFGDGVFGVKMLAPLLHLLTSLFLMKSARLLGHDERTGVWIFLIYLTLPMTTGMSAFFSADTPLLFSWAGALLGVLYATQREGVKGWIAAGIFTGLGLMSKYTMGAFPLMTLAYLWATGRLRLLATPGPWIAAVIAGLIFAPNLLWNLHHQFVTVAHTETNLFSKGVEFFPADLLAFAAAQFGLFGPILTGALLAWGHRSALHWFVFPLLAVGLIVSLLSGAQGHWVAPIYLAGTLIVIPRLMTHTPRLLKASIAIHLIVVALFYAAPSLLPHLALPSDPLTRLFVWNRLSVPAAELMAEHPDVQIASDERKIAAALTYGLRSSEGKPASVLKWNPTGAIHDHYDLMSQGKPLEGRDLLLVSRHVPPSGMDEAQAKEMLAREETYSGIRFYFFLIPYFEGYRTP